MRLRVSNDAGPTLRRETKGIPTGAADAIDFNQTVEASPFFLIVSERSLIMRLGQ
jgi:hypothetical protein